MDKNKKATLLLVLFIVLAGLVVSAYSAAPPKQAETECTDCETGAHSALEGVINEIDQKSAKTITLQLEELNNEDCANQIANQLVELGAIGKIRCDMNAKTFEVQFSPDKVSEEDILKAFEKAEHPGKIVGAP